MTTQYTKNFGLALPDFRMGPWHDLINNDLIKIDGLLVSALSISNVAAWENSTDYDVGINVIDTNDATVWVCVTHHVSAAPPTTFAQDRAAHPNYWARLLTGFAPRGAWAQSTQYLPYDLVYDQAHGIMALCITKHISNPTGTIVDDEIYWAFLLDMSDVGLINATAVSYAGNSSGIPATNVQMAIDYMETQIKSLDRVNVDQGTAIKANADAIAALGVTVASHTTSIAALNTANTTHTNNHNAQQQALTDLGNRVTTVEGNKNGAIPIGYNMIFMNQYAPTGWVIINWHDYGVRLCNDNTGGTGGGIHPYSSVFGRTGTDGHSLTIGQMPSHNHANGITDATWPNYDYIFAQATDYPLTRTQGGYAGGNEQHSHNMDIRVRYINSIACQRTS
jgi:hypothetical protein